MATRNVARKFACIRRRFRQKNRNLLSINTTFLWHARDPSYGKPLTFNWHAGCGRQLSAIGSQASSKSSGHHPKTRMNNHRSILYIGGDFRARRALAEAVAAENYRVVSAAHPQNALSEFGTDQILNPRWHCPQSLTSRSCKTLLRR